MDFLIIIVFGFILMWLVIVLPQRRRQAAHNAMLAGLDLGDEIVSAGGIYGAVTAIGEDEVTVEIADGVEVRLAKRAVAAVLPPDSDHEEDDEAGFPTETALEDARG